MADPVESPEEQGLKLQRNTLTASIAKREKGLATHPDQDGAKKVLESEKASVAEIDKRLKAIGSHSKK